MELTGQTARSLQQLQGAGERARTAIAENQEVLTQHRVDLARRRSSQGSGGFQIFEDSPSPQRTRGERGGQRVRRRRALQPIAQDPMGAVSQETAPEATFAPQPAPTTTPGPPNPAEEDRLEDLYGDSGWFVGQVQAPEQPTNLPEFMGQQQKSEGGKGEGEDHHGPNTQHVFYRQMTETVDEPTISATVSNSNSLFTLDALLAVGKATLGIGLATHGVVRAVSAARTLMQVA